MVEPPLQFGPPPLLPPWLEDLFPFRRHTARIGHRRLHFVDDGQGPAVLLVHGNPTWSFLWRKVITRLLPRGIRVIAPDLIGLGFSDKPKDLAFHTFNHHLQLILKVVESLDLGELIVVGQDWGGPIAAGVAANYSEKIEGAVFANTAILRPRKPDKTTLFHRFSHMPLISDLVFRGLNFPLCTMHWVGGKYWKLSHWEKEAYRYPLRSWKERVAPLALARMVPNSSKHPSLRGLEETDQWARDFEGPVGLVWGKRDPILGRALRRMREVFDQAEVTETEAGHFLQEEVPDEIAQAVLKVVEKSR